MLHRTFFVLSFWIALILTSQQTYANYSPYEKLDHPLLDAVDSGNMPLINQLLNAGHSPDSKGFLNSTPLMRAAYKGNLKVTLLLISKGADIHVKDDGGATALHYAVRAGHKEIIKVLIDKGAHPHTKDKLGHTPQTRAENIKNVEAIEIFKEHIGRVSHNQELPGDLNTEVVLNNESRDLITEVKEELNTPAPIEENELLIEKSSIEEKVITEDKNLSENKFETPLPLTQALPPAYEKDVDDSGPETLRISEARRVEEDYIEKLEALSLPQTTTSAPINNATKNIKIKINGFSSPDIALESWDRIAQSKYFKSARITLSANGALTEAELFIEIGFFLSKTDAFAGCLKATKILPMTSCRINEI